MSSTGTLRIYGCGGFGINIASSFEQAANESEPGYAQTFPAYVDTSKSNLRSDINPEHVYLIDDVDGSGGVRGENHQLISKIRKSVLQTHPPKDFNVVIFSASGGSGSVIGPLIFKELLERGETVVGIVVGSDASVLWADNAIKSLKTLEKQAELADAPVVIFYEHNDPEIPRSEIDKRCRQVIGSLSILASRNNSEMDTKDIYNWINFNRSTKVGARLALFEVRFGDEIDPKLEPISVASLYANPDAKPLSVKPDYLTVGYPRGQVQHFTDMHFVISLGALPTIYKRLEDKLAVQDQSRTARVAHDKIVTRADAVTDDGMVI